jgi:hypothetical protein
MPRVTFNEYLAQRAFLRLAWEEFEQLYSILSPNQQWDLHAYYQPVTDDTEDWLRAHRANISNKRPTLPAKAGKHYARMRAVHDQAVAIAHTGASARTAGRGTKTTARVSHRRVTVRSVALPQPDVHRLSQALIALEPQSRRKEL